MEQIESAGNLSNEGCTIVLNKDQAIVLNFFLCIKRQKIKKIALTQLIKNDVKPFSAYASFYLYVVYH